MPEPRDPNLPKLDAEGYCTACEYKHPCECVPFCEECCEPEDECRCQSGPEDFEPEGEPDFDVDDFYDGPDVDYIYTPPHLYM